MQLAQFPMNMIRITQGENGTFSHQGKYAIDFVGTYAKYPYYAPCDCTCIQRIDSEAMMVWKSDAPVMCADGQVRDIKWWCIHEEPLVFPVGKKLLKGELMGHSGVGARATGDHLHLQVFLYSTDEELHIYDVFAVNGVNMVDGYGYNWRTSEYDDGSGGVITPPPTPETDNTKDLIIMLLSDALNGWKMSTLNREIELKKGGLSWV